MDIKAPFGAARWLLVFALFLCGFSQALAQNKAAQPLPATPQAQAATQPDKVWVKDPNTVMPMRKMTNAERRAAAERNKARRDKAQAQRRQNVRNQGVQR